MKTVTFVLCLLAGTFYSTLTRAQVSVNVSVNVEAQPNWGPAGYDYVNYYYMPDIETYYYVPRHQFVYISGGRWVFASSLPERYHSYDLYRGYKVVVNEHRPYLHHDVYRSRYAHYRDCYDNQPVLKEHGNGHAYGHYKKDHGKKEK